MFAETSENSAFESARNELLIADESPPEFALRSAPVITGDALRGVGQHLFPQTALFGTVTNDGAASGPVALDPVYINTNAPFSAVVCGASGSGKSHSLKILLEGCFINDPRVGILSAPLTGLFCCYNYVDDVNVRPCEAVFLTRLKADTTCDALPAMVKVLVLPSTLSIMKDVYAKFPNVKVEPLQFTLQDLRTEGLKDLWGLDGDSSLEAEIIRLQDARRAPETQNCNSTYKKRNRQRLDLLESCIVQENHQDAYSYFESNMLTVVHILSSRPIACAFFYMVLNALIRSERPACGKVIAFDNIHELLDGSDHAGALCKSFETIMRQQRHLGARMILSTQDVTVVPRTLLSLSSFTIVHRLASRDCLERLMSAVPTMTVECPKIFTMDPWKVLMVVPAGLVTRKPDRSYTSAFTQVTAQAGNQSSSSLTLGSRSLFVRPRISATEDPGTTQFAFQGGSDTSRELKPVMSSLSPVGGETGLSRTQSFSEMISDQSTLRSPPSETTYSEHLGLCAETSRDRQDPKTQLVEGSKDSVAPPNNFHSQLRFRSLLEFIEDRRSEGRDVTPLAEIVRHLDSQVVCPYLGSRLTEFLEEAVRMGLLRYADIGPENIALELEEHGLLIHILRCALDTGESRLSTKEAETTMDAVFPSALFIRSFDQCCTSAALASVIILDDDWISLPEDHAQLRRSTHPSATKASVSSVDQHRTGRYHQAGPAFDSLHSTSDLNSNWRRRPSETLTPDLGLPDTRTSVSGSLAEEEANSMKQHISLIQALEQQRSQGVLRVRLSELHVLLRDKYLFLASLQRQVNAAEQSGLVKQGGPEDGKWVEMLPFAPLMQIMGTFRSYGYRRTWQSKIREVLESKYPTVLIDQSFTNYIARAERAGILLQDGDNVELLLAKSATKPSQTSAPIKQRAFPAPEFEQVGNASDAEDQSAASSLYVSAGEDIQEVHPGPEGVPSQETIPMLASPAAEGSVNLDSDASVTSSTTLGPRFGSLLEILQDQNSSGVQRTSLTDLGQLFRGRGPPPYQGQKLSQYLSEAEALGLVERGGLAHDAWVQLKQVHTKAVGDTARSQTTSIVNDTTRIDAPTTPIPAAGSADVHSPMYTSNYSVQSAITSSAPGVSTPQTAPLDIDFAPLLDILRQRLQSGETKPARTKVSVDLRSRYPEVLGTGGKAFANYTKAAEEAGVVTMGGSMDSAWIQIAPEDSARSLPVSSASDSASAPSQSSVGHITSSPAITDRFSPLLAILDSLGANGQVHALRSVVGQRLHDYLRSSGSRLLLETTFSTYIAEAEKNNLVILGGVGGSAWIARR